MTQFELKLLKTIGGVERYYTITDASNQSVKTRVMEWTENYPRKVVFTLSNKNKTAAHNLLNSTCHLWSAGSGALELGDRIEYSVYPTSTPTVKTRVFYGIITELSQVSGGWLTVTARDYLEKLEYIQPNAIVYGHYRDMQAKNITSGAGARSIDGCTETSILFPAVFIGLAITDTRVTYGTDDASSGLDDHDIIAQMFIAEGNGLCGVHMHYTSMDLVGGSLHVSIQADNAGYPSGADIGYVDVALGSDETNTAFQVSFMTDHCPLRLEKGKIYWLCGKLHYTSKTALTIYHSLLIPPATDPAAPVSWFYIYDDSAGTWASTAHVVHARFDWANYEEVVPDSYYFDAVAEAIICAADNEKITVVDDADVYYSDIIYRGMVSYYYDTITSEVIFDQLIGYDSDLTAVTSHDNDTTYALYQTRGKSVAECLREMADTFETTGAYSGYQHSIAHYEAAGVHNIKVVFGPYPSSKTFSYGADSAVDDEKRIISLNLKKTSSLRPASVLVVGKAATGAPIIAQRDDRALGTSSFRTKSKMALLTTHTDESITTITEANRKAWQILDSYARDAWEGTIVVSGVYPDLFDLSTASDTYGAGGHIHLNYSPLGITDVSLHVKGIVLHENTTEIQVSNADLLLLNQLTDTRGRAERSESFVAPDDPYVTQFVSGYSNSVEDLATLYMQLCTADDTIIPGGARVLCTKTSNSRYNTNTYHAEFEIDNGHTVDGTPIIQLELWSAVTGGTEHATVTLNSSEYFPKWRTTRIIAEVHTKIA